MRYGLCILLLNIEFMRIFPPAPRSSAIGPLATMSHVERSVSCLHCQKVHDRGFIWNFSDTVRVCFTCYRVMGEDARKRYERDAARGESKQAGPQATGSKEIGYARKVIGILALSIIIIGAGAWFLYKPLTGKIAQQRVWAGESRM